MKYIFVLFILQIKFLLCQDINNYFDNILETIPSSTDYSIYIYNLLEQISAFFSMENKIIKFEFNGKDYLINSDRAIPGGLIINDIVSNFYKFCFNSKDVTNSSIKIKMNINKKMTSVKLIIEMLYISKEKYKLPQESENLITGLLNQIQATMTINYMKNKSVFKIVF